MLPGTSAEVAYNTSPPEVVNYSDKVAEPAESTSNQRLSKRWKKQVIVTLVFLFIAALAIGLGVGLRKRPVKTKSVALIV